MHWGRKSWVGWVGRDVTFDDGIDEVFYMVG